MTFRTKILAPIGLAVAGGLVFCLAAAPYSPAHAQSCTSWQIPEDPGTTLYFWKRVSATQVRRCLADGADLRALSQRGSNVLHFAAEGGDAEVAKVLIEAGSNVNAQNKRGVTPIHFAGLADNAEAVKVLIAAGANVNVTLDPILAFKGGGTPLHAAMMYSGTYENSIPGQDLSAALVRVYLERDRTSLEVTKVLLAAGANIDAQASNGMTPLIEAVRRDRTETAKTLIAAGARVDVQDNWGETALSRAAVAGEAEMVSALLDAGADGCARTAPGETMFDRMQLAQKRHEESKFESGPDLRGTDAWRRLRRAAQSC